MSLTYLLRVELELRLTRQQRENRLFIYVEGEKYTNLFYPSSTFEVYVMKKKTKYLLKMTK